MAVDKIALLQAVAAAGEQGRQDYEAAQAANMANQQAALQAALVNAVREPVGLQAVLSQIVGQPYANAQARLTEQSAASADWFNRSRTNMEGFLNAQEGLKEALIARTLAEAAAGGSGGGGGGGGGGDGPEPFDWYDNLKDIYGTAAIGKKAIAQEAKALGLNSLNDTGLPRYQQTRDFAMKEYGIPEGVANDWFQPSEYESAVMADVKNITTRKKLKQFRQNLRKGQRTTKGNQAGVNRRALTAAKQQVKQRRRKKR